MAQALRLAERGLYSTSPNPRVGCVIVRDGVLVGEGWHQRAGEAHAAAWRAFLARDYGDASPGEDTNGDDRTYNAQAVDPIEGWDAARPPAFENRFDEPYVWETYRRFLVELNHGFFESIADQARKRGMSIALALSSHGSVFYPGGPPSAFGGDPSMQASAVRP